MNLFTFSPQSTKASEKSKFPGDNALFSLHRELRKRGYSIIGSEVALLPDGLPITLQRRKQAILTHQKADISIIFGSDTERKIKDWFPVGEALRVPQPYFFIMDPGRISLELIQKLDHFGGNLNDDLKGFSKEENLIG